MDGHVIIGWLMQAVGIVLMLVVLLDVFFTVLYARINAGFLSHRLACWTWYAFRSLSRPLGRHRPAALTFCGPVILLVLVSTWVWGFMLGAAMVIAPRLGTSITSNTGPTPTGFVTALYVAGDAMTTVGTSDMAPRTGFFRTFYTACSLVGLSIITLTLTYFLEIYSSLKDRNTMALKLHLAASETADAAELLAGVGPGGEFNAGYAHLAEMAAGMLSFKESHHFYSVLLYFRFGEPHYAVSRVVLLALDTVTLIKSALDDRHHAWLKESVAVEQIWRGSMRMLTMLADSFLPQGMPEGPEPDEHTVERWRQRYYAAARRLRQADIRTTPDERAGAETYVALRAKWDRYIVTFANHMAHDLSVIDPVGTNPESTAARQDFRTRLRSAG